MKKIILSLFIGGALCLAVSSCSSDSDLEPIETIPHVATSSSTFAEVVSETSFEGVKVVEGMLVFDSQKRFNAMMSELQQYSESALDEWEEQIGFYSLRRKNNLTQLDPDVDDYEFDRLRLPDIYLETVLNPSMEINVSGKVYSMEESIKSVTPIPPFTTPTEECRFARRLTNSVTFNNIRQTGEKWNTTGWFYKSVGASTTLYRQNKKGKWKRSKEELVSLLLDQWATLDICKIDQAGLFGYFDCVSFTNESKSDTNASKVTKTFRWMSATYDLFCVPVYGRIHHWANNQFNNDCHTEAIDW